ncbi:MAG: polyphenol oxidase family protein [Planctomycetota bacterium]|nr:polyphenol oxidase family protein [Planctomycetota bacterium]MDA1114739.1 polyphenol oxidase family protein [Planctomycetota bacterium]
MQSCSSGAYRGYQFAEFQKVSGLAHVFGGRSESDLGNLAYSGGRDLLAAQETRRAWSRFLQVPAEDWVVGGQVHTHNVALVDASHRGQGALSPEHVLPECDGLMTTTRNLPLYVAVADCSAVLLHAPGVLAVVHGGWRGLAKGILGVAVKRFASLGVKPSEIRAGIAPCIAAASYEVGPEVGEACPESARYSGKGDRWQVDIALWAQASLVQNGVEPASIILSGIDTGSNESCFSHRRQGQGAGRNGLIAVLT